MAGVFQILNSVFSFFIPLYSACVLWHNILSCNDFSCMIMEIADKSKLIAMVYQELSRKLYSRILFCNDLRLIPNF